MDPGTADTGYGVIETGPDHVARLIECGVIRTRPGDPLAARLLTIHDGLGELIARHRPDAVAVEDIFYAKNVRTTVVLGHARGVVLLAAEAAGIPIGEYTPAVVKQTVVGRGAAQKAQVGYMVAKLLRLAAPPSPADAADGVAVALTHLLRSRAGSRLRLGTAR